MTELFRHEQITTTEAKAKAIRPLAERLVTTARKGRAERLVELAQQHNVERLSAWFSPERAKQLIDCVDQGNDQALQKMAAGFALHARRQVLATLSDKKIAHKLVDEIAPRFDDRPGGYTRIFKLGMRKGDSADMALLELVE